MEKTSWRPERLRGSSSEATRLPGEGKQREDWKEKTGRVTSRREIEVGGGKKKKDRRIKNLQVGRSQHYLRSSRA